MTDYIVEVEYKDGVQLDYECDETKAPLAQFKDLILYLDTMLFRYKKSPKKLFLRSNEYAVARSYANYEERVDKPKFGGIILVGTFMYFQGVQLRLYNGETNIQFKDDNWVDFDEYYVPLRYLMKGVKCREYKRLG
jgi:hypothetical protein